MTENFYGDFFMRIRTDLDNENSFFTDSNSFLMLERTTKYPEFPIAGNYYPITSAMYIENSIKRVTLLTAQPAGKALHCYDVITISP